MKSPPHPGLSVRHDCLEPLGLTVTEAAKRLGVSRKQLSDIVNGRAGISPEMAIRLDKAFGGGAGTWLRLQAAYDLAQAIGTPTASTCGASRRREEGAPAPAEGARGLGPGAGHALGRLRGRGAPAVGRGGGEPARRRRSGVR